MVKKILLSVGILVSISLMLVVRKEWIAVSQVEREVEAKAVKVKDLDALVFEQQFVEKDYDQLKRFFPEGEEGVARVAESLEAMAASSGVVLRLEFEDFPDRVDIGGAYQTGLAIEAVVEGPYQSGISWLKAVEALPYFVKLTDVKVGPPRLGGGGVRAEFSGVIFLR